MSYETYFWLDAAISAAAVIGTAIVAVARSRRTARDTRSGMPKEGSVARVRPWYGASWPWLSGIAIVGIAGIIGRIPARPFGSLRWLGSSETAMLSMATVLVLIFSAVAAVTVTAGVPAMASARGPIAIDSQMLQKRTIASVGPRAWFVSWLIASGVLASVLVICVAVSTTNDGRSALPFTVGEWTTLIAFPGWASSWALVAVFLISVAVGVLCLGLNARLAESERAPSRECRARVMLAILVFGTTWALASVLGEVGAAGSTTLGFAGEMPWVVSPPFAALGIPLLIFASVLRGGATGIVLALAYSSVPARSNS